MGIYKYVAGKLPNTAQIFEIVAVMQTLLSLDNSPQEKHGVTKH